MNKILYYIILYFILYYYINFIKVWFCNIIYNLHCIKNVIKNLKNLTNSQIFLPKKNLLVMVSRIILWWWGLNWSSNLHDDIFFSRAIIWFLRNSQPGIRHSSCFLIFFAYNGTIISVGIMRIGHCLSINWIF